MELDIWDDRRLVEIWLTRGEAADAALRAQLRPLYGVYAAKKYTVALFLSGEQDLTGATSDLLCYNRKRLAQLALGRPGP